MSRSDGILKRSRFYSRRTKSVVAITLKVALIFTGAGELFRAKAGKLIANTRATGYRTEQVDVILLTHIQADHSGGLSIGGKRVFSNPFVYVDKRDPNFWLSAAEEVCRLERECELV
jgi:Zn-dependent hydrolases, including glyoxylases